MPLMAHGCPWVLGFWDHTGIAENETMLSIKTEIKRIQGILQMYH